MAVITVRAVKLAAFSGAAVPLLGFSGRVMAESKDGEGKMEHPVAIRACDIPMYPVPQNISNSKGGGADSDEPNMIQKQITNIRVMSTDLFQQLLGSERMQQIKDGYEVVRGKAQIGVDHSKSTLDYVQNNPGELPRVGLITMAVLGGVVIGYRKSVIRKCLYASIAGASAAALCYPTFTVDFSRALTEDCKVLWKNKVGWPLSDDKKKGNPEAPAESKVIKVLKLTEDHGQSKSEDKDLYSNRSS